MNEIYVYQQCECELGHMRAELTQTERHRCGKSIIGWFGTHFVAGFFRYGFTRACICNSNQIAIFHSHLVVIGNLWWRINLIHSYCNLQVRRKDGYAIGIQRSVKFSQKLCHAMAIATLLYDENTITSFQTFRYR